MKNLKLLYHIKKQFKVDKDVRHLLIHSDKKDLSFICDGGKLLQLQLESETIESVFDVSDVVAIEHLALNDEFCIATAGGDVLLYIPSRNHSEVVSFCDGGIETMAWSPDQEVVAFVTRSQNVVVMSCQYDPINEALLNDGKFGDQEFITVGWGKKETQFHGSEGKEAAKKKEEIVVPNLEEIDNQFVITWRSDGEYFAVGFVGTYGRMFKVFNKEGVLQFTSEQCSGLESPIAWRPSGLWIAVPQTFPDKYTIALFEKNGLRHREIILPFEKENEAVTALSWSNDSEILIVETLNKQNGSNSLYLYVIGNYHWYVKQYLEYPCKIISHKWDIKYSEGRTLHVLLADGTYHIYRWEFSIDHSTGKDSNDESVVAVIDGSNVLLTNFRATVIPPPMCGYTLKNKLQINKVGFLRNPSKDMDSNMFFVVDVENQITFYRPEFTSSAVRRFKGAEEIGRVKMSETGHHWTWINDDTLVATDTNNKLKIFKLCLTTNEVKIIHEIDVEQTIGCIESFDSNVALIEFTSGEVHKLDVSKGELDCFLTTPEFCEQLIASKDKIFSLKNRQTLYLNGSKLKSDVTSYFVTEKFLIFTTIASLIFIDLNTNSVIDERRVERGSKLVIVVPKDSRTILQLPRGNLEAVHPRVLSLCIIADHLDAKDYRKAFDILRKERINLNLMVDHNPSIFLSYLKKFIDDIDNPQWLNLFLTDLQNQDVCVTMYASNYQKRDETVSTINGYKVDDKINYICDKMIDVFNGESTKNNFILPMITCYVKKKMLEHALDLIWTMKKDVNVKNDAEGALKYLLYLVDVNELYNVALGMYDFGLVLFVATKSQKDPKEYLPFLNELKKLDNDYRKYKIDCHLKRFGKAIENISRCDDDDKFMECLEIVKTHNLYTKAMASYKDKDVFYKKICRCYGDYLRTNNKLIEASLMYERAGDYQQALSSARNVLDWERCLRLGKIIGFSEEEMKQLCSTLVPALEENGQYKEAAYLIKNYEKDIKATVETLMKGKLYSQAIFEAIIEDPDIIQTSIKPNFNDYLSQQQKNVEEETALFSKYKNRLQIVREEKAKRKLAPDEDAHDLDDCDLFSDTTSMASSKYTSSSNRTGKSHRSSKNRRKHERKLLSLKEGNQFEDIALVDALHALIHRVYSCEKQNRVKNICKVAIELDFDNEGVQLQKTFSHLLHIIKISLDHIWIPEMMVSGQLDLGLNTDYAQVQNEQHYAMIKPHQRYKPDLTTIDWQYDILK